jgi:hypothetical protein
MGECTGIGKLRIPHNGSQEADPYQITYSVTVAEEQRRDISDDISLEVGFQSANSAAMEAMLDLADRRDKESQDRKLHPMFRRDSGDSSRSRSVSLIEDIKVDSRTRGSRAKMNGVDGRVKEGAIEVDLSDGESEVRAAPTKTNGDVEQDGESRTDPKG